MNSLRLILQDLRYFAPVWVFASINILMGTWVLYIPAVKEKMGLDDGELGIALFCYALGILIIIPFIPKITRRFGAGRYTIVGIVLFSIAFLFPLLASSYVWLCISLFVVGVFSGSTDISMNALVSEIEKQDKVNFMSAAHGFFSLGGAIGAGIGSFLLLGRIAPVTHISLVALFLIVSNLLLAKNYFLVEETQEEASENTAYKLSKYMPLIALAFIAFGIMASEGAIENWSKLYLLDVIHVESDRLAGFGFVLFSITMTIGRFLGDGISQQLGSKKIIIGGCLIAVLAYLGVLSGYLYLVLAGFGLLGLGLSVIIPELFRMAGKTKEMSPSAGIAFVSGIGFFGFLLGPVVLGLISDFAGLKMSFVALLFVAVIATVLSALRKDTDSHHG